MASFSKICLSLGLILLVLSIFNSFTVELVTPSFQRSEILAVLSSIVLILISIISTKINSEEKPIIKLLGKEGFYLDPSLKESERQELAWGSKLFLTNTSASTILIYLNKKVILRRGIISDRVFITGPICSRVIESGKLISLVNTKLFPGRKEFDCVLNDLPSVLIVPVSSSGLIILGGYKERAFSKVDEKWLSGWAEKLSSIIVNT